VAAVDQLGRQLGADVLGFEAAGPAVADRSGDAGRSTRRRSSVGASRSSVSGLTNKHDQRDLGSTRLTAASSARSAGSSLGRGSWRRSTVSWWRSTSSSKSLAASPRASSTSSWTERQTVRYASFDSTRAASEGSTDASAYRAAVQHEPAGHSSPPCLRTLQASPTLAGVFAARGDTGMRWYTKTISWAPTRRPKAAVQSGALALVDVGSGQRPQPTTRWRLHGGADQQQ